MSGFIDFKGWLLPATMNERFPHQSMVQQNFREARYREKEVIRMVSEFSPQLCSWKKKESGFLYSVKNDFQSNFWTQSINEKGIINQRER